MISVRVRVAVWAVDLVGDLEEARAAGLVVGRDRSQGRDPDEDLAGAADSAGATAEISLVVPLKLCLAETTPQTSK